MGLPLRRTSEAVPFFRRGRTLAGPLRGSCHSGAHPHPPRMCSAPSPRKGEGFRAADSRPYGVSRSHSSFIAEAGPRMARQAWGNFRDTAGGAHPRVASLAPAGQFTFSPSPTNRKKTLRVWVGEPLGTPAGGKQRGHPHPPPSGAPSPLEGEGLGPVRIRTGSVGSANSGAVLESQRF